MVDPVGAIGAVVDLIGTVRELVNTEKEKWGRYKELPEHFERLLRELNACDEQLSDFKNSYKSAEDEFSEELKRSYVKLFISRKEKLDEIKAYLEDLKTKIPKSGISSGFRQWFKVRATDRNSVARADDTSETISTFVGALQKLSKECHDEMKGLHEKRGDQYVPHFYTPSLENILKMNDDMTAEGQLKQGVMAGGEAIAVLGCLPVNEASSSGSGGTTSMKGMDGIGKTKALHGLANDEDVKKKFKDGILFMTFGKEADEKKLKENLCMIVRQSGGKKLCKSIDNSSLQEVIDETAKWFKDKKVLFICDDLWPTASNTIGCLTELKELKQSSSSCHLVLTTRYGEIASKACRKSGTVVKFKTLDVSGRRAHDVLLKYADISETDFESLSYKEKSVVQEILVKCGGLYLALAVAGGMLLDSKEEQSLADAVQNLSSALSEKEEDLLDGSVEEHNTTLYCCFEESLERINEWAKGQGLGDSWYITIPRLCVYQKNTKLTKEMMKCVWLEEYHVDKLLKKLRNFHLLEFEKDAELCTFHDLFHDFCIRKAGGEREVPRLHREFLDNVAERCGVLNLGQSSAERICGRSWWTLKDVGGIEMYMRSNLARHLKEAGKVDELEALMTRFEWTLLRFKKNDYNEMMNDLSIWVHEEEKKWKEANEDRSKYIKKRQMRQAISSAWSKSGNEKELACEILSHLLDSREVSEAVRSYIGSVESIGMKGWLRPLQQVWEVPSADVINVQFWIKDISVNWMRNQAIVVGEDSEIALLNLSTLSVRMLLNNISRKVTCVAWSKSGNTVILGSEGEIMKCNVDEESIQTICNVGGNVRSVDISDGGSRVAYDADDNTVRVWDIEKGEELCVLEGHERDVTSVAISGDGSRVVSGSYDRTVRVWEVEKKKEFCVFKGHKDRVSSVAISGDGSRVVSGSWDKTVRVWDVEKGKEFCFEGHSNGVSSVAISRDGCRVVSGSDDGTVRVWDAEKGSELCVFEGHEGPVRSVAISEDGSLVVSGSWDRTVRVWKVEKQTKCAVFDGKKDWVDSVAISGDLNRVVSASYSGTIRVWDGKKRSQLCLRGAHTRVIGGVAISSDGSRVVSGSYGKNVRVWDAEKGTKICVLEGHEDLVSSVSISEDGNRVVSGSWDKTVRVWEVEKGAELCVLEGHEDSVLCVAMSRDGSRVVSGSWDSTVRVWEVEKGVEMCVLEGHEDSVLCVAISRDGNRVVYGSDDGTIRVWNVESREELCVLESHDSPVDRVSMSEDGSCVASRSEAGQLLIWKAKDNAYGHKPNYVSFPKLRFRESYDVGFIGQRIVIGFGDGRILQYDMIE